MSLLRQIGTWRHVFKLDPNRPLSDAALECICTSKTDAIIIGGTDGITYENTHLLWQRVKSYEIPCVQEISTFSAILLGCEGYLIPSVLNTEDAYWLKGAHYEAIRTYGDLIPWEKVAGQGYVILNPEAKVSRLTHCNTNLSTEDLIAYARLSDQLFHLPIFYIEYSGTYGQIEMVRAARRGLRKARLFYGGGIRTQTQAEEMATWADTIVIGNLVYEDLKQALASVAWVKETAQRK